MKSFVESFFRVPLWEDWFNDWKHNRVIIHNDVRWEAVKNGSAQRWCPTEEEAVSKLTAWEKDGLYSIPAYLQMYNREIKQGFLDLLGWTDEQFAAWGPELEIAPYHAGGADLRVHWKHKGEGKTPPTIKGVSAELWWLYLGELFAAQMSWCGLEYPDAVKGHCGWQTKHADYNSKGYTPWAGPGKVVAEHGYLRMKGSTLSAAITTVEKQSIKYLKDVGRYAVPYNEAAWGYYRGQYLSMVDIHTVPPTEEALGQVPFLGNEGRFIETLLNRHVFGGEVGRVLLRGEVQVELDTYRDDSSQYSIKLTFTLADNFDEVIFVLTEELFRFLRWSEEAVRSKDSKESEWERGDAGWWRLTPDSSTAIGGGGKYVLRLRIAKGGADMIEGRDVVVQMRGFKSPRYIKTPELIYNRIPHQMAAGRPGVPRLRWTDRDGSACLPMIQALDPILPPHGLRLLRVAGELPQRVCHKMGWNSRGADLHMVAPTAPVGGETSGGGSSVVYKFHVGQSVSKIRVYELNQMALRVTVKVLHGEKGTSLETNRRVTAVKGREFRRRFFEAIRVECEQTPQVHQQQQQQRKKAVLYELRSGGGGNRAAEEEIISWLLEDGQGGAYTNKDLDKQFEEFDFKGSKEEEIDVPLFTYGEMPPFGFLSRMGLNISLKLADPNGLFKIEGRSGDPNPSVQLRLINPRLIVPSVHLDPSAPAKLAPVLKDNMLAYVQECYLFQRASISPEAGGTNGVWSKEVKVAGKYDRDVLAYIVAVREAPGSGGGGGSCIYKKHRLFSLSLVGVNLGGSVVEANPILDNHLKPPLWKYTLGGTCDTQRAGMTLAYSTIKQLSGLAKFGSLEKFTDSSSWLLFPFIPEPNYPLPDITKALKLRMTFSEPLKSNLELSITTIYMGEVRSDLSYREPVIYRRRYDDDGGSD